MRARRKCHQGRVKSCKRCKGRVKASARGATRGRVPLYVMRRDFRGGPFRTGRKLMSRLRAFFKRHMLLVGLAAVVVPLLSIIGLQYLSLRKLEKTSIVAGGVGMKNFLSGVANEIKTFYKSNAETVLAVAPSSLSAENFTQPKGNFPVCKVDGARRLFVTSFDQTGAAQTLFFDPNDTSTRIGDV